MRRRVLIYNLDAIISVGYRVKRKVATQFRIWATERLREFLLHGYALNQQRLAELGTGIPVLSRSDDALTAAVATISEGFDGTEPYVTTEGKTANLRYLVLKDHPLVDRNKRSAVALFVTFLARNGILNRSDGTPRITNNALAAATLMIAMSNPGEKRLMVARPLRMLVDG